MFLGLSRKRLQKGGRTASGHMSLEVKGRSLGATWALGHCGSSGRGARGQGLGTRAGSDHHGRGTVSEGKRDRAGRDGENWEAQPRSQCAEP